MINHQSCGGIVLTFILALLAFHGATHSPPLFGGPASITPGRNVEAPLGPEWVGSYTDTRGVRNVEGFLNAKYAMYVFFFFFPRLGTFGPKIEVVVRRGSTVQYIGYTSTVYLNFTIV